MRSSRALVGAEPVSPQKIPPNSPAPEEHDDPLGPFDEANPFIDPQQLRRDTRRLEFGDNLEVLLHHARIILRESRSAGFPVLVLAESEQMRQEIVASLRAGGLAGIPYKGTRMVEKALEHEVAMVVMEGNTSTKSNLALCQKITNDPRARSIPVLVFSPDKTRDAILHASRMGAAGYLVAPFSGKTLLEKVAELRRKSIGED